MSDAITSQVEDFVYSLNDGIEASAPDKSASAVTLYNQFEPGSQLCLKKQTETSYYPAITTVEMISEGMLKFWHQRYRLFSKFDQGILMDEESWYSVTPEIIAKDIAEKCNCQDKIVLDAFCGVGGNTIQFALAGAKVIAIDQDDQKITFAKNNAQIYGVLDKIDFYVGNCLPLLDHLKVDIVFLSPPWGGPKYLQEDIYNINTMMLPLDGGGFELFRKVREKVSPNIAFFVPRNINAKQIESELLKHDKDSHNIQFQLKLDYQYVNNKVKACTIYSGNLADNNTFDISKCVDNSFSESEMEAF